MRLTPQGKRGCVSGAHLHFEIRKPLSVVSDQNLELTPIATSESRSYSRKSKGAQATLSVKVNPTRLKLVEELTLAVNPADYISAIDTTCQETKLAEVQNMHLLNAGHTNWLGPLTMSRCGRKSEGNISELLKIESKGDLPAIYSFENQGDAKKFLLC
jgi:hypothetical protein